MPSLHANPLVDFLCDPHNHPDRPEQVELVETHLSWVFLTRRYAYKLKKPIAFDFVDFATLDARKKACGDEVRLNRRLARSTYLGVTPITDAPPDGWTIGGGGAAIDYTVKMWRLPAARRWDELVREGRAAAGDVRRICAVLVKFYAAAPPLTARPEQYLARLERHVLDNRRDLVEFDAELGAGLASRVHAAQLALLRLAPHLFAERVCDGRIVEGHGDLRPEHIYLMPEPVIVDCIEFSDDFRRLDVADELCFLAMELRALDAPGLADQVLRICFETLHDHPDSRLLEFYQSYRACVRGKVAALRSRQLTGTARDQTLDEARRYLTLADSFQPATSRPFVLAVGGGVGTGKSTLARALAEALGVDVLSSDELRRERFGASAAPAEVDGGLYRPELRSQVYEEMLRRAGARLAEKQSVVLDATFSHRATLEAARTLAETHGALFLPVQCRCPAEVARQRIAARQAAGQDASEARPEFVADATPHFPADAVAVDTTLGLAAQREEVFRRLAHQIWDGSG